MDLMYVTREACCNDGFGNVKSDSLWPLSFARPAFGPCGLSVLLQEAWRLGRFYGFCLLADPARFRLPFRGRGLCDGLLLCLCLSSFFMLFVLALVLAIVAFALATGFAVLFFFFAVLYFILAGGPSSRGFISRPSFGRACLLCLLFNFGFFSFGRA